MADEACEEALLDSTALRRFVGIDLGRERVPDGTTLLKFRRLLEKHELGAALFTQVNQTLQEQGLKVGTGTIVDATIIGAPSSTKNADKTRDPDMHQMLSNKAWKWLGSYELGGLRLTMHSPTSPLNTRDLCDAIRLKLRDNATFDHPSKAPLRDALEEILSASNLTWKYLNGGRTKKRIGTSSTGSKWNS